MAPARWYVTDMVARGLVVRSATAGGAVEWCARAWNVSPGDLVAGPVSDEGRLLRLERVASDEPPVPGWDAPAGGP